MVFFATDAPPQDLLALGTTEDVFALVARGPVDAGREGLEKAGALVAESPLFEEAVGAHRRARPKRIKRITYRIVAQRRSGQQRYVRPRDAPRFAAGHRLAFPELEARG